MALDSRGSYGKCSRDKKKVEGKRIRAEQKLIPMPPALPTSWLNAFKVKATLISMLS